MTITITVVLAMLIAISVFATVRASVLVVRKILVALAAMIFASTLF